MAKGGSPAGNPATRGHEAQLKRYWAFGEGARKWIGSAHPWTTLRRHLSKYVPPGHVLDGLTDNIYKMVFHRQPPHSGRGGK